MWVWQMSLPEARVAQICAISASTLSIVFALVGIVLIVLIHPSNRKFRHQLILGLIGFDLIKGITILAYCGRAVNSPLSVFAWSQKSVDALGWFTVVGVQGSDIIILCFAIHLFLTVFTTKLPNIVQRWLFNKKEGGLYPIRYLVWFIVMLVPILIASLGMLTGYNHSMYWAFFRSRTVFYQLTWIFRYTIVGIIFVLYIAIYLFVMLEYRKVREKMRLNSQKKDNNMFETAFGDSLWYKIGQWLLMFIFPDVGISAKLHGQDLTTHEDLKNIEKLKNESVVAYCSISTKDTISFPSAAVVNRSKDPIQLQESADEEFNETPDFNTRLQTQHVQDLINQEAMERFEIRRLQILSQMKLVFIYPLSFVFLWVFPFVKQCVINYGGAAALRPWSEDPAAFFQALNAVIDVIVFMLREKPWRLIADPNRKNTSGEIACDSNTGDWRAKLVYFFSTRKSVSNPDESANNSQTSNKRDIWVSSVSTNKGYSDFRKDSAYESNRREVENEDDYYKDIEKEEDLLAFLNRGPPDLSKMKKFYSHRRKSANSLPPVSWNLNVFENGDNEMTPNKKDIKLEDSDDKDDEMDLKDFLDMV